MTPLRSNRRSLLCVAIGVLLSSVCRARPEAPESISQALCRHGIALTEPALVDALSSADREVRWLAAAELAEMKARDRLPEILGAAEIEKDPNAKLNIAEAATWMGSAAGLKIVREMCGDLTLKPWVRISAARVAFDRGDHACFRATADLMLAPEEEGIRSLAIHTLAQMRDRTAEETTILFECLIAALGESNPRVRMDAAEGLRLLFDRRAIPFLQGALASEPEEYVRARMQSALDLLTVTKR